MFCVQIVYKMLSFVLYLSYLYSTDYSSSGKSADLLDQLVVDKFDTVLK